MRIEWDRKERQRAEASGKEKAYREVWNGVWEGHFRAAVLTL